MKWNWLWLLSGLCFLGSPSSAQTNNDWRNVDKLAIGTPISVVKRVRLGCEFVRVTDSALTCDGFGPRGRTLVIARDQIREIRLERPSHNKMIVGAIIGAGLCATLLGVPALRTNDAETRVFLPIVGFAVGAFLGGEIGRHIHQHGAIFYSRN